MAQELEQWLKDNWEQVRVERGLSWEQLAAEIDKAPVSAPDLAAWARGMAHPEKAVDKAVPKPGRKRLSTTADTTPTETA